MSSRIRKDEPAKPAQFDTSKQNLRRVAERPWHQLESEDALLVIFATAKGFLGRAIRDKKCPGEVKVGPILI